MLPELERAADVEQKVTLQERIFELGYESLSVRGGLDAIYRLAPRFDDAGLFEGSDWAHPERLQPGLVQHTIETREGLGVEVMSQLRLLAIANEKVDHDRVAPDEARAFLERVLALNLASLFPVETDDGAPAKHLFEFIVASLGAESVMGRLVVEAERILLTRPIDVSRVRKMIDTAARNVAAWGTGEVAREAMLLVDALYGPTPLSRRVDLAGYRHALDRLDEPALMLEADTMAASMRRTGLVCPQHATLVRWANEHHRRALVRALGIEQVGRTSLDEHWLLVRRLVEEAIHPGTAQSVYGLARLLDRGLLFRPPVPAGLRKLLYVDILPDVAAELTVAVDGDDSEADARAVLIAGALSLLGQPLGVDQGQNPTCQAARAISLWAQNDPGILLGLVAHAARDGNVVMYFEGQPIESKDVERGVAEEIHSELDPISLLLTPHLDRIYWEMSRRALDRDEDEHKWVNPEFHGWWVHRGFATLIDEMTRRITSPSEFVRWFYACYHPSYNGGREVVVPQPCGIAITNMHGNFVDWHAISLQRVDEDPTEELRAYFFNPNHDTIRDWGHGVTSSTSDHGEVEGESSLPFHQFAARVYLFHYDPTEVGDPKAVPDDEVERVVSMLRNGWAADFEWAPEDTTGEESS